MTPSAVHRDKPSALHAIFGHPEAVIGAIHLAPLPGSPSYECEPVDALIVHAVRCRFRSARMCSPTARWTRSWCRRRDNARSHA